MILDVDRLQPGMILLDDVLLPNGMVLLNAGKELTSSLIETLSRKGIDLVQVVPDASARAVAGDSGIGFAANTQTADASVLSLADEAAALLVSAGESESDPESDKGEADSEEETLTPQEAQEASRPEIMVSVSRDGMSARLSVAPRRDGDNILMFQDITAAMSKAGVVHGVDEKAIRALLDKWGKLKRLYEIDGAARGTPAVAGAEGDFEMAVRHLNNDARIEDARHFSYYWQLLELQVEVDRVNPGTVIAQRGPTRPSEPGISVTGSLVPTLEIKQVKAQVGKFVELDRDRTTMTATQAGIVFRTAKGVVGLLPLDFNGLFELRVSTTFMRAEVVVHPPGPGGKPPSRDSLDLQLKDKGVVFGIDHERIAQLEKEMEQGVFPKEPLSVAEALKPTNGENGRFELKFNTETSLKPKENPDGSLDYKNIDIIASVSKGDTLATLLPPTKGVPGKDILGHVLPAGDGVPAVLPVGANTEISPDNPNLLVSTADGNVSFTGTLVEVNEGYTIKGNVDYATGNVRYKKSVTVGGDVVSGFSVTCGGDLQVNGTIEDCDITTGGNVLCRAGFVGTGKGLIESRGDINVGFLKNQKIRSRGSVSIARESINGSVSSRKAIYVHGNPLSIAGGCYIARDLVDLHTVGNISGVKSIIEVGLDYVLQEELVKTEHQLNETTDNLRKILDTYKKYERLAAVKKGKLPPREIELYEKIKVTLVKYQSQIKALESRIQVINSKMYNIHRACVKIRGTAHPGTIIRIGERHLLVKEQIIGPKTVRLVNFEVKVF